MKNKISLEKLSNLINGELQNATVGKFVTSIAPLESALETDICFYDNVKLKSLLSSSKAGVVIMQEKYADIYSGAKIIHPNPRYALAIISQHFAKKQPNSGIHPSAVIGDNCTIAPNVVLGANVVIGDNVTLQSGVRVLPGSVIEDDVFLGENTEIKPNVTIMHSSVLGENCIIHSGTVIGSDGFGYAPNEDVYHKIFHLGRVILENNVEIGANTTVDRGTFGDTVICNGVKLDNQIQVAHNVRIGANTVIAGCTGIAGSSIIGENCQIGGSVGISGHLKIVDNVVITVKTLVAKDVLIAGVYSSSISAMPQVTWNKNYAALKKLYSFMQKINLREKSNV